MSHQEIFAGFVEELNELQYVFVRGFLNLPEALDTDVDIVSSLEDFPAMVRLGMKWMTMMIADCKHFGFAEWCDMEYAPFHTDGIHDPNIPNGRFRVDMYNSLYFLSPYKGFTANWTVPKAFNEAVLAERIPRDNFFIPHPEHEIMLLVCRDVFDKQGQWSNKHMSRVIELLPLITRRELHFARALLGFPEETVDALYDGRFFDLFGIIMGKKQ